mmetsp:Transcript_14017/g.49346  ORF Transcript_14017/g.49346 Transcript_14017/m.49346 type:complete len:219 (+) Transcript_14017:2479-3135(+)
MALDVLGPGVHRPHFPLLLLQAALQLQTAGLLAQGGAPQPLRPNELLVGEDAQPLDRLLGSQGAAGVPRGLVPRPPHLRNGPPFLLLGGLPPAAAQRGLFFVAPRRPALRRLLGSHHLPPPCRHPCLQLPHLTVPTLAFKGAELSLQTVSLAVMLLADAAVSVESVQVRRPPRQRRGGGLQRRGCRGGIPTGPRGGRRGGHRTVLGPRGHTQIGQGRR